MAKITAQQLKDSHIAQCEQYGLFQAKVQQFYTQFIEASLSARLNDDALAYQAAVSTWQQQIKEARQKLLNDLL
jgi:hypothetical protein